MADPKRIEIRQDCDGGNHPVGRPYLLLDDLARAMREGVDARINARLEEIAKWLADRGLYHGVHHRDMALGNALCGVSEAIRQTAPREPAQEQCPRCASPKPELHGAMQADGGEVQLCTHPWHGPPALAAAESRAQAAEARAAMLERERDEARYRPGLGDNHHNAMACPYCNPGRRGAEPGETQT